MRRNFVVTVLAAVLLCEMLAAQQPKPKTFTNADVIKMAKAGLDDSTIVLAIQQHPAQYDTSADALIELKTQGVSQAVINAMLTAGKGAPPAAGPSASGAPATGNGKWHKFEDKSAFDDSKQVSFLLEAEGSIEGPIGSYLPKLVVRCKEKETDVFVSTGMAASVEEGTEDHHVRIRLDGQPTQVEAWGEATNNEALFSPHGMEFVKQLANAKKLAFGFTPFDANPQVAIFNVEGLGHQLAAQDVCGWDTTFSSYK